MNPRVALLGDAEALELTAVSDGNSSGWIWCGEPEGAGPILQDAELVVALGTVAIPGRGADRWVRWLDGAASEGAAPASPSGGLAEVAAGAGDFLPDRVIAQAGPGLWRRSPWPVGDDLFELPAPPASAPVLVLGPDEASREAVAILEAYGVHATAAPRLTLTALQAAAGVLELAAPGAPAPAWVMAPLAARRVLLRVGAAADLGLQAGIDHVVAAGLGQAATLASALLGEPRAFDSVRAFGALTAERHRASTVLARMLTDVRLERAAPARADGLPSPWATSP